MHKFINSSLAILFLLFVGSTVAQQWSDTQKEIWKTVEEYWSVNENKNLEGYMSYFDESYKGWMYNEEKPRNKKETTTSIKDAYEKAKDDTWKSTLTPLEIWVNGDFAFVDYTYSMSVTSKDSKITNSSGRWTDILKKKGDKWVIVGDHGGDTSK